MMERINNETFYDNSIQIAYQAPTNECRDLINSGQDNEIAPYSINNIL